MEFFALYADGEGIRAKFLVHLSDFTASRSQAQNGVDEAFLERSVIAPEDVGHFFANGEDIFGIKVRGFRSIRKFLSTPRALRALRTFNLTHMTAAGTPIRRAIASAWRTCCWERERLTLVGVEP